MKLKTLLTITSVYLAVLGVGFIFAPLRIGTGAVPPDAPGALIAYLRQFGAPLLGIAVLNWTARNAEPSTARNSIILGNIVGFGLGPFLDAWGLVIGARKLAVLFAAVHLLVALGFILAWRSSASGRTT